MEKLPPEIVEKVLAYLLEPEDLNNAAKTCKQWENILYSNRHLRLFGQVFPLLVDIDWSRQDMLTCRQVSKYWCRGVDHFLETYPYFHPHHEHQYQRFRDKFICSDKDLPEYNLIDMLVTNGYSYGYCKTAHFTGVSIHPRNPIIGRCVRIQDFVGKTVSCCGARGIRTESIPNNHNNVFLKAFGRHIWTLHLIMFDVDYKNPKEFVNRLLELLAYVPNLKTFSIAIRKTIPQKMSTYPSRKITNEQKNSLPKMLETLVLNTDDEVITKVVMKLLANTNLKCLQVYQMAVATNVGLPPNLVDLRFNTRYPVDWRTLSRLKCPLQKIRIYMNADCDVPELFGFINQFQKTLQFLDLQFHNDDDSDISSEDLDVFATADKLSNFRVLKRVSVCLPVEVSLNFLSGLCTCLEYLEISRSDKTYPGTCSSSSSMDDGWRAWMQNIFTLSEWKRFPKLRSFTFRGCFKDEKWGYFIQENRQEARRDDYERYTYNKELEVAKLVLTP